jgi:hypothetical protein
LTRRSCLDQHLENLYYSRGSTGIQPQQSFSHTFGQHSAQNPVSRNFQSQIFDLNLTVPARTPSSTYAASWTTQAPRPAMSNVRSTSIFGANPFETVTPRQTSQATISASTDLSPRRNFVTSTNAARSLEGDDRPIFGGRGGGATHRGTGRQRGQAPSTLPIREHEPATNGLQRQNTFALDEPSLPNLPQSGAQRPQDTVNVQDLYNVRRRNRAQTPVAFTVNLNEAPQVSDSGATGEIIG